MPNDTIIAPPFPGTVFRFPPATQLAEVREWQTRIVELGFTVSIDGDYRQQSVDACKAFQTLQGLTVDGKVGRLTWDATFAATPGQAPAARSRGGSTRRPMTFGWEEIHSFVQSRLGSDVAADPTPGQSNRGPTGGGTSHHFEAVGPDGVARSHAIDYGLANSDANAIFDLLLPLAQGPGAPIRELFFDPRGGFDEGIDIGPIGSHDDHVHVAIHLGAQLPA